LWILPRQEGTGLSEESREKAEAGESKDGSKLGLHPRVILVHLIYGE
jgi:hypothetical protein